MKRKLFSLAVLAICAAIITSGTVAFFTYSGTSHNVITMGTVKITLSQDGQSGIMPDTTIHNVASITNIGTGEMWLRVKSHLQSPNAGLPVEDIVVLYPGDNWIYEDGYYYYNKSLQPGEAADCLYPRIYFRKEMGNEFKRSEIHLVVTAEAVQTIHNPVPDGGDVSDVKGWPG